MFTLNSTENNTLFYFDNVNQLTDYESFSVCPVNSDQDHEGKNPKFWSVIGKVNQEKASGLTCEYFPVADLSSEMYAEMFADMCRQIIEATSVSLSSGSLHHNRLAQSMSA